MTDVQAKPVQGEVLPPLGQASPLASVGIPIFTRIENRSRAKTLQTEIAVERARNELLRLYNEQTHLIETRFLAVDRLRDLPATLEAERSRVRAARLEAAQRATIGSLQNQIAIEDLETQLIEAKRRRALAENPTKPEPPPKSKSAAEKLEEQLAELNKIDEVLRKRQEAIVASVGGEKNLTENDRLELSRIEMLRRSLNNSVYESFVD